MTDFTTMGLPDAVLQRLNDMGLTQPTPIQARAIPLALEGRDVMGLAQTGTGKTAAFGVPLVTRIAEMGRPAPKEVQGLVLAPTRELAGQIVAVLRALTEGTRMKIGLVVGGQSLNAQANRLEKGTDILVATPGRLIDLLERRAVRLGQAKYLVLDEADQMLDMGFIHALRQIVPHLPDDRQTMLFSATMPKMMAELAGSYLKNPERIEVSPPGKAADKITQSLHFIAKAEKSALLVELLDKHRDELALVFARTKHGAERLMKSLQKAGFAAGSIHGNKSQGQRDRALKAFRDGELRVLVATDVAARGLDIPAVRHVYNYDLPNVPDNYVHRIGRTARAGMDGQAVAFCAPDEVKELRAIQKVMKTEIPVASGRPWEGVDTPAPKRGGAPRRDGAKPRSQRRNRPGRARRKAA
ncbi:DEAD/DEAH box helicase [Aestuariicoccus sp. MJ-SS9]|uniref:DEAD/DEAH box helicase n=1 Tax=Aestuariicoccus sp. MJ-SS9 TaxID=3079855 RepID=UPI002912FC67|nr:DEAD/DEAH box helicase [Aestuariicoccus sp. MJ-SS9]MDU8911504.1 DEAD/DEAH box helicase [Aestuariicoccus sp. MJ-SS9]